MDMFYCFFKKGRSGAKDDDSGKENWGFSLLELAKVKASSSLELWLPPAFAAY